MYPELDQYFPLLIIMVLALVFSGLFIFLAFAFGPKNPDPEKLDVYECGVPATGDARHRFSVKFFIVAMIFLLFDVEVVFLFPWAILLKSFKAEGMAWQIFWPMLVFLGMLGIGLIYEWKRGALDWEK